MKVTLESLTKAFRGWEDEYRADPSKFLNPDEVAALDSEDVSVARSAHLKALLRSQEPA